MDKYLIHVPSNTTKNPETVSGTSGNEAKIYFDHKNQKIWNRGVNFTGSRVAWGGSLVGPLS